MREHILPFYGFTLVGDTWVNPEFSIEELRSIPDADVERHHTRLTGKLMLEHGKTFVIELVGDGSR